MPAEPDAMPPPPAPLQNQGGKEFNPNSSLDPGMLTKDSTPVEIRRWILKFQDYIQDGVKVDSSGGPKKPSGELLKRQLLNKSDSHWFNRLSDQLKEVKNKEWSYFEEKIWAEMELLFPIMK